MITIACVLKSGGIYTPEWVRKLRDGVARNIMLPHRFVCLSDVEVPCERIHLAEGWPGWWSKIELFCPGVLEGPVLYFDLDTVVVGSLDKIGAYPHRITMAHEFYRPHRVCSTAMAWNGDYSFLFDHFAVDPAGMMHRYDKEVLSEGRIGDQAYIEDELKAAGIQADTFRDLFGERSVASYKVHKCQTEAPADAAVVAFHGNPKPNAIKTGWVADAWK